VSKRASRTRADAAHRRRLNSVPTSSTAVSWGWRSFLIVFGVAAAMRLLVAFQVWDLPLVRTPKLDSFEYVSWARRLAAGDFSWPIVSQHGPGYPFFLAALLTAGAGSLRAAIAAQAVLGALTAAMIAAIAREWSDARAGLAAGLAYGLYGPAVYIDTALLGEGLLMFLLVLAVWMLRREPVTAARAAGAGVALGAATLVRPTALLTVVAGAAWLTLSVRRRQPRAFALAGWFVAACLLVVSPALAKNWSVSRSLSVQGYGGMNFYIGNSPRHTGRPTFRLGAGWDALNSEASRAGIADPASQDRYYVTKTLTEIRESPFAFLALLAAKTLWLVQSEEVRDSHSYYFFADQSPALRVLPRMAVLFPLACAGVFVLIRMRARTGLLAYYSLAAVASTVLLVVGTRYRMPIVPALAIAAGPGVVAIVDAALARRRNELVVYAAIATIAIGLSHALSDPRNHNMAEEWAFTGSSLITERNLPAAEAAFRRALALDPSSSFTLDGLGLAQYNAGRLDEARKAFARAIAHDPDSARAVYHLALVDDRERHAPAAIAGYRRALALSPYDGAIARDLGLALLAERQPADAVPHLRMAAAQAPLDADAHRALGTSLGLVGQTQDARAEMQRAVELMPSNGEAWLDLCLLSLDLNDVEAAMTALQRARDWGAGVERVTFAADALARARRPPSQRR
jgi:Flp pilus assembly protein TadD